MKRLILFLIRKRLHISLYQPFRFDNQKSKYDFYCFTKDGIIKFTGGREIKSHVSLNWILDEQCKIIPYIRNENNVCN